MSEKIIDNLGPLAPLAGIWESDFGVDTSRIHSVETVTKYRERAVFEPIGPVNNGPQKLFGLRYSMTAWPLGSDDAFHEELGYWLWDGEAKQVMRCFMVPRSVLVCAVGSAEANAKSFEMSAKEGDEMAGILSTPFLVKAFKTVQYLLKVTVHDDGTFSYEEDTQLKIHGQEDIFHHTDANTLSKVK